MALTKEAVDKLKELHRKETGEELSEEEAWEMATRLLELARLIRNWGRGTPDIF